MKPGVKDVAYCATGAHHVPREKMTTMQSTGGKHGRFTKHLCEDCKTQALEKRKQVKGSS